MYVHTSWHVSNENWGQVRINFVMFICIHVATREPLGTFLLNLTQRVEINVTTHEERRSQWPRVLRRRSAAARLLRLWVRIPPGHGCSF